MLTLRKSRFTFYKEVLSEGELAISLSLFSYCLLEWGNEKYVHCSLSSWRTTSVPRTFHSSALPLDPSSLGRSRKSITVKKSTNVGSPSRCARTAHSVTVFWISSNELPALDDLTVRMVKGKTWACFVYPGFFVLGGFFRGLIRKAQPSEPFLVRRLNRVKRHPGIFNQNLRLVIAFPWSLSWSAPINLAIVIVY